MSPANWRIPRLSYSSCFRVLSYPGPPDGTVRPAQYILNRASRIYSVALPALALTWLTDNYLLLHYPGTLGALYQYAAPWKYLPLFLSFSNDFWFLSEDAFSNIPYWSLCYEVWYYVVFGALVFGRGFWRWGIAIAALLLMGPRLWLLWPIWLARRLSPSASAAFAQKQSGPAVTLSRGTDRAERERFGGGSQ